jgi:hypothetical protein
LGQAGFRLIVAIRLLHGLVEFIRFARSDAASVISAECPKFSTKRF